MKFKFYGNKDCPEWFLAEIILVNKITAVKIRLIMAQIILKMRGLKFDINKISKFCKDSGLSEEETMSVISSLHLLIESFVKFSVDDAEFLKELSQLGLSQEIAESILSSINKEKLNIANELKKSSMRIDEMVSREYLISYLYASSVDITEKSLANFHISTKAQPNINLIMPKSQLKGMIIELQKAEEAMSKI